MQPREGTFYVVTGSGFGVRDGGWIRQHMPRDGSVAFKDVSSAYGVINLCGPPARDVLARGDRGRRFQRGVPLHGLRLDPHRLRAGDGGAHHLFRRARVGTAHPDRIRRACIRDAARGGRRVRHHGCGLQGDQQPAHGEALPLLERRHLAGRDAARGGSRLRGVVPARAISSARTRCWRKKRRGSNAGSNVSHSKRRSRSMAGRR